MTTWMRSARSLPRIGFHTLMVLLYRRARSATVTGAVSVLSVMTDSHIPIALGCPKSSLHHLLPQSRLRLLCSTNGRSGPGMAAGVLLCLCASACPVLIFSSPPGTYLCMIHRGHNHHKPQAQCEITPLFTRQHYILTPESTPLHPNPPKRPVANPLSLWA